jgi:hypothetical protein
MLSNAGIKSVAKPTADGKKYGMWNMMRGKYSNASSNYIMTGDGVLLLKEDLKDLETHNISISAPHNIDFPDDESQVAKYQLEENNQWLTIAGGDKGKNYILINFQHPGERLMDLFSFSTLFHSYHIGKTAFYKAEGCEDKVPHSSLIIIPRDYFSIIKYQPWMSIRSEYLKHKNMSAFIDVNGDGIIKDDDLIEGKVVYGKSYDGYVSDIRMQLNNKKMTEHINVILINSEPDDDEIYRSRIEHVDIVAEPSYEIIYKKVKTIPNVKRDEYPRINNKEAK